jgi:hypothetical protein
MAAAAQGELIQQGWRNNALASHLGRLRAFGASAEHLLAAGQTFNAERCWPPLPIREVARVAKSIAKYPAHPTTKREWAAARIPPGHFDPRFETAGFDAYAVLCEDTTLGLKPSHRALYAELIAYFGVCGSHPAQKSMALTLNTTRQQIARDIQRLVTEGLITVTPGARKRGDTSWPCDAYHFRKHRVFSAYFGGVGSSGINEIRADGQQFQNGEFSDFGGLTGAAAEDYFSGKHHLKVESVAPVTTIHALRQGVSRNSGSSFLVHTHRGGAGETSPALSWWAALGSHADADDAFGKRYQAMEFVFAARQNLAGAELRHFMESAAVRFDFGASKAKQKPAPRAFPTPIAPPARRRGLERAGVRALSRLVAMRGVWR